MKKLIFRSSQKRRSMLSIWLHHFARAAKNDETQMKRGQLLPLFYRFKTWYAMKLL